MMGLKWVQPLWGVIFTPTSAGTVGSAIISSYPLNHRFRAKVSNRMFNFTYSKFSLIRPLSSYSKIQYLVGLCIRNKRIQLLNKSFLDKGYLNCGCGPNIKSNFINLDWSWRPGIDLCWDAARILPMANKSLNGIYTEHMLEHLCFDSVVPLLEEFKRILKKNGTLRIVVPDAELYLDLYHSAKRGESVRFPYGDENFSSTPMMHVNRVFRGYEHQYAYDFQTLSVLLHKCGYSNITRQSFGQGGDPNLFIDSEGRRIESLYVEAVA